MCENTTYEHEIGLEDQISSETLTLSGGRVDHCLKNVGERQCSNMALLVMAYSDKVGWPLTQHERFCVCAGKLYLCTCDIPNTDVCCVQVCCRNYLIKVKITTC